jgi:hypothetical protein
LLRCKEGGGSQDCRSDGRESWLFFSCILNVINTETFRIDLLCCVEILDMIMHLRSTHPFKSPCKDGQRCMSCVISRLLPVIDWRSFVIPALGEMSAILRPGLTAPLYIFTTVKLAEDQLTVDYIGARAHRYQSGRFSSDQSSRLWERKDSTTMPSSISPSQRYNHTTQPLTAEKPGLYPMRL